MSYRPEIRMLAAVLLSAGVAVSAAAADENPVEQQLRKALAPVAAQVPIESVKPAAVKGLYEVTLKNEQLLYVTGDGKYFIAGDLYSIGPDGFDNISDKARAEARSAMDSTRKALMAEQDPDTFITYPATGTEKAVVTVFTDVTCPYCRRLHAEMPKYNAKGITVRYAAYPRAGLGSEAYDQMVNAWCAENPREALDDLKKMKKIPDRNCENPVADQFRLGQQMGVRGTPAIITSEGAMIPGYMTADQLAEQLGIK